MRHMYHPSGSTIRCSVRKLERTQTFFRFTAHIRFWRPCQIFQKTLKQVSNIFRRENVSCKNWSKKPFFWQPCHTKVGYFYGFLRISGNPAVGPGWNFCGELGLSNNTSMPNFKSFGHTVWDLSLKIFEKPNFFQVFLQYLATLLSKISH